MATTTAMVHSGKAAGFGVSAYSIAVGLVGTMEGVAIASCVGDGRQHGQQQEGGKAKRREHDAGRG